MVVIRLSLRGRKNRDFYSIVTANTRQKRGSFIEKLGYFDPYTKKTHLDTERYQYWIKQGAQITPSCHTRIKAWFKQPSDVSPLSNPAATTVVPETTIETSIDSESVVS